MPEEDTLRQRIVTSGSLLSRKQKRIARFTLDNEYFVAFASASEVGGKVDASAATVVRFCQAIGYQGFPHLQAAIREKFPRQLTTVQRVEEGLVDLATENDLLARVFSNDSNNIEHTASLLQIGEFEAATDEICRASQILVVGGGLSAPPALFLAHSLEVMGFPVRVVTTGGVPLALALASLEPTDVLICISFWRYFRESVEAMYRAKEIGAKGIAITDSELSPLTQVADFSFLVFVDGVAHSISPTASVSLINAFIAALSFKAPEQTLHSLRKVDASYRRNRLLLEE